MTVIMALIVQLLRVQYILFSSFISTHTDVLIYE